METGTFYKPFPKKLGLLSCITYASTVPPGSLSNCSWFILLTDMERNNLYFPLPVPNLILVSSTHSFTTAKNGSLAPVLHSFELCFYLKSSQSEFQLAITEGETSVSMRISKVWREDQRREEEASGCPTHAVWQLQRLVLMKTLWCFTAWLCSAWQRDHQETLSWSGMVTGQFFASLLILNSWVQLRQNESCSSISQNDIAVLLKNYLLGCPSSSGTILQEG